MGGSGARARCPVAFVGWSESTATTANAEIIEFKQILI